MRLATTLSGVAMLLGGCRPDGFLEAPAAGDDIEGRVGSFAAPEGTRLLATPVGEAEALLGRAVLTAQDGGWTIADARAAGCEVRVQRTKAHYDKEYRTALSDLTSVAAGYADVLGLQAQYGRSIEARVMVTNLEVLRADSRGPCGDVIVDSVLVGSGERRLVRSAKASVEAAAGKGPLRARADRSGDTEVEEAVRWDSPQAYAFTTKAVGGAHGLTVKVGMPGSVEAESQFEVEVATNRDAYVVVFYVDADGQGEVLWPAPGEAPAKLEKAKPLNLGPLRAVLPADTASSVIETLVVYAFAELGDYERFRPEGAREARGAAYAARLTQQLSGVPMRRWARATTTYEIVPKQ